MNDRTITATRYEFSLGGETEGEATHVGLHVTEQDGTRTTLAMPVRDAELVGKMLVSHADYVAQRPPRDW
ncbi:Uncharacterised protein [Mycobacteroides abscessus subsp. abscessus]|uniref:hypothetical protein n=1 Tax=Mycobacteroides abscessus TaxID=36809 RepID=UPI00092CCB45|nr:hypothetical protein [Mycobacteroides abscessus]SHT43537.1 Uncharacterised protein [Mycobacteroides abscessus subsp. abscessus]SLK74687.1 Uncharacterised protein [Mycobacteroides abscessus subsp. abscessus]